MDWDKKIEEEIKKNAELKKVFDEHPERKEMYKQKLIDTWDQHAGPSTRNPKFCMTCAFRGEKSPDDAHCMIYLKENGVIKPNSVYCDGKRCEYYHNETEDAE